jgi:hypothetical protein
MRRSLTAVCLTALLISRLAAAAAASAVDDKKKGAKPRPDLSGTWSLDVKKSTWAVERNAGRPRSPVRLVIRHREPEIKITRTALVNGEERTVELTYYADGRGEKNPLVSSRDRLLLNGTVESEAKWKDGRLLIQGKQHLRSLGDLNEAEFTERWELSADGKTLTQTTRYDDVTPRPARMGDYTHFVPADTRYVYTREQ